MHHIRGRCQGCMKGCSLLRELATCCCAWLWRGGMSPPRAPKTCSDRRGSPLPFGKGQYPHPNAPRNWGTSAVGATLLSPQPRAQLSCSCWQEVPAVPPCFPCSHSTPDRFYIPTTARQALGNAQAVQNNPLFKH